VDGGWVASEDDERGRAARGRRGGVKIGAHTITHPDLSQLDYAACQEEISGSRRELEDLLGASIKTFVYPFCDRGLAARAAVEDAGFQR
jgi:peptidoglycan/xylan/chitin deacetylase (PgdA/CDA1 family)